MNLKNMNNVPPSATDLRMNLLGIVVFFAVMALGRFLFPAIKTVDLAAACLLITALPLWFYDP
jgi:hypothetical protein